MFPFLLLVALAAQAMGVLNACNQFAVPGPGLHLLQHRLGGVRAGARASGSGPASGIDAD